MILIRNADDSHDRDEGMRMEDFASACAVRTTRAAEAAG